MSDGNDAKYFKRNHTQWIFMLIIFLCTHILHIEIFHMQNESCGKFKQLCN